MILHAPGNLDKFDRQELYFYDNIQCLFDTQLPLSSYILAHTSHRKMTNLETSFRKSRHSMAHSTDNIHFI